MADDINDDTTLLEMDGTPDSAEPCLGLRLKTKDGVPHTFHMTPAKARSLGLALIRWADELEHEAGWKPAN